jgi:hypothetical protein
VPQADSCTAAIAGLFDHSESLKANRQPKAVRILMINNWGWRPGRVGGVDYQAKPDQVGNGGCVTATGGRLWVGLRAPDQRPSTGGTGRYFSCCLPAGLGDRAKSDRQSRAQGRHGRRTIDAFPSFSGETELSPCVTLRRVICDAIRPDAIRPKVNLDLRSFACRCGPTAKLRCCQQEKSGDIGSA